ncbi:MAG TPA: multifunctional oxoglutarate decarboxylase/oxoglutarate dehydrogenase thiamine pyrophosphate-binding subunit/dihydrolipoyllysine-residue succinyltransferase subunit [Gaiellaceae bacterium]|nr:multifunctional oxoglutarate decarboxylase/oxoglutarate dehydrogenase thiamine pyrophosphate-binding subunit/dihydrolipoyllysine-residue succinyltransferase subunit [Gaiellaceae bacterium]
MEPVSERSGLNAAYVDSLREQYRDNPESVDPAWRAVFARADSDAAAVLARPTPPAASTLSPARVPSPAGDGSAAATATLAPPTPAPIAPAEPTPAVVRAVQPSGDDEAAAQAVDTVGAVADEAELLPAVASAMALVDAIRTHGHLAARLDPLGSEPLGDPALDENELAVPLTPDLQARIPAALLGVYVEGEKLADVLPRLRAVYCGPIAYEIEHISDYAERNWLRRAIESGRFRRPLAAEQRLALLERLSRVEAFETYLRRAFLGQKQFSIEGLDSLVPMLDEAIELAAEGGAHEVVLGIAHRGRLNVLVHTVGRSYASILREFEGEKTIDALISDPEGGTGDVKYHLAASESRLTRNGEIQVTLAPNPSHLEAVDPVVEGRARAEQTDRSRGVALHDPTVAFPILIHGDASFAGQGVVAETFNLHSLDGYSTGGTLHVIANNQVGFTTDPAEGRSTRYSSDLAKGFDVPIVHVNADDPEAALSAIRLSLAYREEFGHDVVVDLVGYRRFGHNEQDEASYTQPLMAERIERQSPVRESYAARLIEDGVVTSEQAAELFEGTQRTLREAHDELKASFAEPLPRQEPRTVTDTGAAVVTAVAAGRLAELDGQLLTPPEGFTINPKLARQLERRRAALEEGGIDWGQAEGLAFATLLEEGIPIRLSGQDTERGTFSHRHAVLHDPVTGETFTPLQALPTATASFEIYNSPLSEYAALAFDYGYSVAAPDALVLWEAQFGDFVNGAQIVVDQFIVSGRSKWGQTSRLTLLLPHGYEGNGPEHSSARLERFLQLAAQDNIRVANCTTSAQYFHLLRRQALDATARPLVVMTPKGLLRVRQATATLEELATGSFRPVLDDDVPDRAAVRRLVLCSGKVYYDIVGHELRSLSSTVAVARIELLYPFPVDAIASLVSSYPELQEIVWAQEEPQNMGAWRTLRHRLEDAAAQAPSVERVVYVGRPWRASPSEGYPTLHTREQDRIVREALGFRSG